MIYRFIMLSDEVDDFRRDFKLDSGATFKDLHDVLIQSVNYNKNDNVSFFICDGDWNQEAEISLIDKNTKSEDDLYLMNATHLEELLEDERQKLIFTFDSINKRSFFIELREMIFGEKMNKAEISNSNGNPPIQILVVEEEIVVPKVVTPLAAEDDEFYPSNDYTEEGFNDDELDSEGFDEIDDDEIDDIDIEELDI